MNSIEAVVQHQLEAYNARDLARLLALYSDDIHLYRKPAPEPAIVGKPRAAHRIASSRNSGFPSRCP